MRPSKNQNYMDIAIGTVFHYWTTTSIPYRKNKQTVVDVVCKCGKNKCTRVSRLLNKTSTSCGCKPKSKRKHKFSLEEAAHKEIYRSIKNGAKDRGYGFSLTEKQVEDLVKRPCHYCNSQPSNVKKIKNRGELKYNGIDRSENAIGYTVENCVPCCTTCNTIKLDLSTSNFIEHINKILAFNKIKNTISIKKLNFYLARALAIANQSHDSQTKVGAILIDPNTGAVMAEGYNGFVRGGPDDKLPTTRPEKYDYIIHAETNLLCNAVRSGVKTDGCIIFCTLSPCIKCLRMLWQAGINTFYFKEKYSDFDQSKSMLDLKITLDNVGDFYKMTISPNL